MMVQVADMSQEVVNDGTGSWHESCEVIHDGTGSWHETYEVIHDGAGSWHETYEVIVVDVDTKPFESWLDCILYFYFRMML